MRTTNKISINMLSVKYVMWTILQEKNKWDGRDKLTDLSIEVHKIMKTYVRIFHR